MSISQSTLPANNQFAFTGISKKLDKVITDLSIIQLLENCELLMIKKSLQDPDNAVIKISLSISPEFKNLKGLFNGLISLGQPKEVNLTYQKDRDYYELKYIQSGQAATSNYLVKLIGMIEAELRFKTVLKSIIENQKAFDASQQLLRKEIFN